MSGSGINIPVLQKKGEPIHDIPTSIRLRSKNFRQFCRYKYPLRETHLHVEADTHLDIEWFKECNHHIQTKLTHREWILLQDYYDIYSPSLRNENIRIKDLYSSTLKKKHIYSFVDHIRYVHADDIRKYIASLFRQNSNRIPEQTIEEVLKYRVHRHLAIPRKSSVISSLTRYRLSDDGIDLVKTFTQSSFTQSPIHTNSHTYNDVTYRLAYQYIDLLESHIKKGTITQLFYPMTSKDSRAFKKDCADFIHLSYPDRYDIFLKYEFYFKLKVHYPEIIRKASQKLLDLFSAFPPLTQPMTVYRGIRDRSWVYRPWRGLISTSLSKHIAREYEGRDCCLLHIHLPPGLCVIPLLGLTAGASTTPFMEILLPDLVQAHYRQTYKRVNKNERNRIGELDIYVYSQ